MFFSRDYRRPFWLGFFHATLTVVYCLFVALLISQMEALFNGEISAIIELTFGLFLGVVSVAMCAWLIFYEPVKKLLHHHFRAATVMLLSTLGWLFVYLIVFLFGLMFTIV